MDREGAYMTSFEKAMSRRVWVGAIPPWLPNARAGAGACPYVRLVVRRRWRLVGSKA